MFIKRITDKLAHPLTRGMDIDDPETSAARSIIIQKKPFLKQLYEQWYRDLSKNLPGNISGPVIELGSGGGFIKDVIPGVMTSEIQKIPNIDIVLDGMALPFCGASLRGILMIDVFHHLPGVGRFLAEATRCVKPGGVVAMIEPWNTPWSRLIYKHLHHEPFHPEALDWNLPKGGPLSQANSALPWMVFSRDRDKFSREFPQWEAVKIRLHTPFAYLLSGGVSMRSLVPDKLFHACRKFENLLLPLMPAVAMFSEIVLARK